MTIKRTTVITGLLALAALSAGCGVVGPLDEETASYDVADKVAALQVEADSGTVEVVESDRQGIHVTEQLSWRKNKPEPSHEVQGDTLVLKFKCATTWGLGSGAASCEVSYKVEVPKGLRVKVRSDSGTLTLKNLSGGLEASSDSGTIEASGLAGKQVVTRTDSGDMTLAFTGQPDKVATTTDSGRTVVRVPSGPYNIVARTDSGDKKIEAAADSSAQRSIELTSDSGDLEVVNS
ncbi:DUF4097 family beta strand repeat-containing protein [Nonomuraea zeae]|nr:DUF4097 family beta strand repeat-containing protein [Nonomuraea zeae]